MPWKHTITKGCYCVGITPVSYPQHHKDVRFLLAARAAALAAITTSRRPVSVAPVLLELANFYSTCSQKLEVFYSSAHV